MELITLDYTPKKDVEYGILILSDELRTESTESVATADIKKGVREYSLPKDKNNKYIKKYEVYIKKDK